MDEVLLQEVSFIRRAFSLFLSILSQIFLILQKGYPSVCAAYNDPSNISERLPIIMQKAQKLSLEIQCKH